MKTIDRTAFVPLHLSWQIAHSIAIFVESLCLFAYILLLQLLLLHTEMKCTFHAAQCHVMYTKERPPCVRCATGRCAKFVHVPNANHRALMQEKSRRGCFTRAGHPSIAVVTITIIEFSASHVYSLE